MHKNKKISWIPIAIGVLYTCLYLYTKSPLLWLVPASLFFVLIILFSTFLSLFAVLSALVLLLEAISWIFDWLRNRPHPPKKFHKFDIPYIFAMEKYSVQTLQSKTIALEIIKYFFLAVASLCAANAMIMLACSMYASGRIGLVSSVVRFPLARSGPAVVDSQGRIYCSSETYDRLQVYDRKGHFIRGWFFYGGYYSDSITVGHNDLIYVKNRAGEGCTVFDVNGKVVNESEHWPPPYARSNPALDAEGNIYESLANRIYSDEVVKVSPTGKESVIISDPFYLRIITALFPACIIWFPIVLVAWAYQDYQKSKKEESANN